MATIQIKGVIGQDYTYKTFINDYAMAKGEPITLLIDSVGGYVQEGNLIAEFIRSHSDNFARVTNSGNVASIASNIFLALPFEKRFFDMARGVALIHNPMATELGQDATAEGLKSMADLLEKEQNDINTYIAKQTGADKDVIGALMAINEPLTESQLTSINFANIIKFKAIALLNQNEMNKQEIEQTIDTKMGSWFDKIMAKMFPFKAIMLTDANGEQLDFPEVPDGGSVKVGDKVNAPDGEVVMPSGETYVIAGGILTEIKPVTEEEEVSVDLEAMKAELEALKAENEGLKAQAVAIDTMKAQLATFKSEMARIDPIEKPDGKEKPSDKFQYNGRKK